MKPKRSYLFLSITKKEPQPDLTEISQHAHHLLFICVIAAQMALFLFEKKLIFMYPTRVKEVLLFYENLS